MVLAEEERATLERWVRQPTSPPRLALRCRIVLACAEGQSNLTVSVHLGVNKSTVSKWRVRFIAKRLDGLLDDPRPGPARTVTASLVEAVIVKTFEEVPVGANNWSTRSMAREMGMSQSSISRMWRTFGLKPHQGYPPESLLPMSCAHVDCQPAKSSVVAMPSG
jgi:transposase